MCPWKSQESDTDLSDLTPNVRTHLPVVWKPTWRLSFQPTFNWWRQTLRKCSGSDLLAADFTEVHIFKWEYPLRKLTWPFLLSGDETGEEMGREGKDSDSESKTVAVWTSTQWEASSASLTTQASSKCPWCRLLQTKPNTWRKSNFVANSQYCRPFASMETPHQIFKEKQSKTTKPFRMTACPFLFFAFLLFFFSLYSSAYLSPCCHCIWRLRVFYFVLFAFVSWFLSSVLYFFRMSFL